MLEVDFADVLELVCAARAMLKMFTDEKGVMSKFNWGDASLSAGDIRQLNENPIRLARILRKLGQL